MCVILLHYWLFSIIVKNQKNIRITQSRNSAHGKIVQKKRIRTRCRDKRLRCEDAFFDLFRRVRLIKNAFFTIKGTRSERSI